ncbi:MAG: DUF4126 family protein [Pyrinomonadaceae bacterium]
MDVAVVLAAFGMGIVAGLRSLTAPAVVCWTVFVGWMSLAGTPFAFLGSRFTLAIVTVLALGEFIGDKLPKTPKRTARGPLLTRCLMGGLSGGSICAAARQPVSVGVFVGIVGAILGAFSGYEIRRRLVKRLGVKDMYIAIAEDLIAIGLAIVFVRIG